MKPDEKNMCGFEAVRALYRHGVFDEVYPLIERLLNDLKENHGIEMMDILDRFDHSDPAVLEPWLTWLNLATRVVSLRPVAFLVRGVLRNGRVRERCVRFVSARLKDSIEEEHARVEKTLARTGRGGEIAEGEVTERR